MATPRQYRAWQELPAWGTADAPPRAFRVFRYGANEATKFPGQQRETVWLTKESAAAIVKDYLRRQILCAFDFNHELKEAYGWFDIEARADGLWVVNAEYTADTLELFQLKKIRYGSPYFATTPDAKGRQIITSFLNYSLTNFPATDQQRPLIALSRTARSYTAMTAEEAKAKADEIIAACEGNPEKSDAVALLLISGEAPADAPADDAEAMPLAAPDDIAIAQTARELTKQTSKDGVVGALRSYAALRTQHTDQAARLVALEAIEHGRNVDAAIAARKLTPAQKGWALAQSPAALAGYLEVAVPSVDTRTLTPPTVAAPTLPTPEGAINDAMRAYCAKVGSDVNAYAATWVSKYGAEKFTR